MTNTDLLFHFVPFCLNVNGKFLARYLDTNYYISECGNVIYNAFSKKIHDGKGRKTLCVRKNGKPYPETYYRVVITAWKGKHPNKKYSVDHIDRNHKNIHMTNLRWASSVTQGKNRSPYIHPSKTTFRVYKNGHFLDTVFGIVTLAKKYGVYISKMKKIEKCITLPNGLFIMHIPVPHQRGEIFKVHPKLPAYKISNHGRVIRINSKFQDPFVPVMGSDYVAIRNLRVHRLVYELFVGPIPPKYIVDHIDNVKTNNRVENLQAISQSENILKDLGKRKRYPIEVEDKLLGTKRTYRSMYHAHQQNNIPQPIISKYTKNGYIYKNRYTFKKIKVE